MQNLSNDQLQRANSIYWDNIGLVQVERGFARVDNFPSGDHWNHVIWLDAKMKNGKIVYDMNPVFASIMYNSNHAITSLHRLAEFSGQITNLKISYKMLQGRFLKYEDAIKVLKLGYVLNSCNLCGRLM
jgi:hypothetical protein